MANKKITIEVDVDTKKVDEAVAKTGKLKDLGKGLKIQYDVDGKPVDVVIDKTLNLQKQVKILTAELRRTKEGTAEFELLSKAANDAKDDLGRVTAKSNDLFSSLSLLPGPVGQFFGQLQGGIELLKTFSSFTFKDLSFQFKETSNDIADVVKNLLGINGDGIDELSQSTEDATQSQGNFRDAVSDSVDLTKTQTLINKQNLSILDQNEIAYNNLNKAIEEGTLSNEKYGVVSKLSENGTRELTGLVDKETQEFRKLSEAELKAAVTGKGLTITTEGLVAAEKAATFWTSTLGTTIKAVLISTGILAAIVVIGELVGLIYKWVSSTEDADKANKSLTETIKEQQRVLENDQQAIELSTRLNVARAKAAGKTEQEIFEITKQGGKDRLELLREFDKQLYDDQKNITKNTKLSEEDKLKLLEETNGKILKNGQDITKQIIENEIGYYDNLASLRLKNKPKTGPSEADQILLRDLNARIKLEIDAEKTSKDKLEDLLNQKRKLRIRLEKLTVNEVKVLDDENKKLLNNSLIDDTERTIQAEIDKNNRLVIASGIGTKELFDAKRKMAQEQFLFELKEAERDEMTKNNKIENATTKHLKTLIDIDKEALDARIRLSQEKFDAQYEGTEKFFELQRQLELDNYAKQQADARLNNQQLEAIKQTHQKKLIGIDIAELQYKSDLEGRKADTEQENFTKVESRFMESFAVIKDLNTRKYDDLRKQEDLSYQADLLAAGDNVKVKEQIEREHAAKMRQIGADEVEAKKQTTLMIENVTQQFGQTIGQIGDLMMQQSQGRDKKMFEAGKKAAIAGIAIEKIATIASIVTNTAIANAKSVAAFPLTLGMPWVAINTISAGLSIAATIAAGISAISQINGTNFEAAGGGAGGATSPGNQLGRNYEKGGLIKGKRHAEGGTMIEAERGEAIMTRGAVTAFSPLLSMMNQMGGGTAFSQGAVGQAGFDNPKVATPSQEQTPMIVKTYVVSTDMTSEQNKQARLKNLSTL